MWYWVTQEHKVVFRNTENGCPATVLSGPRPVPVECRWIFDDTQAMPVGVLAIRRAAAHILQLGWEAAKRGEQVRRGLERLEADEPTLACIKNLQVLQEGGDKNAERALFALCRLHREGQLAFSAKDRVTAKTP